MCDTPGGFDPSTFIPPPPVSLLVLPDLDGDVDCFPAGLLDCETPAAPMSAVDVVVRVVLAAYFGFMFAIIILCTLLTWFWPRP